MDSTRLARAESRSDVVDLQFLQVYFFGNMLLRYHDLKLLQAQKNLDTVATAMDALPSRHARAQHFDVDPCHR